MPELELRVPFALTVDGELASPLVASKTSAYTCPDCGCPVSLRRRRGQRPHFTHHPSPHGGCSAESVTHKAAELLLKRQLERELREVGTIAWFLRCPGVEGSCRDKALHPQYLPVPPGSTVALEVAHQAFRFDVAVLSEAGLLMGFEVYFRHLVPESKASQLDVPWLELTAEDILEFKPRIPIREGVAQQHCESCAALAERLKQRAVADSARAGVDMRFRAERDRITAAWQQVLLKTGMR